MSSTWQRRMRRFHREMHASGGGAFQTSIVRKGEALHPVEVQALAQWFDMVRAAPRFPLCLGCEHEFGSDAEPDAFCITTAFCDKPGHVVVTAICDRCAEKDNGELMEIAYQGFRKMGLAKRKLEAVGTA